MNVHYIGRIYVSIGDKYWLFEKLLPNFPLPPVRGMSLSFLGNDDDAGDSWVIENVEWNLKNNEIEVLFEDDEWDPDYPHNKTPVEMYGKNGWEMISTNK